MLTASYGGKIIEISNHESPKEELELKKLLCHVCDENIFVKHGIVRCAHFCHYPSTKCDFEGLQGEPETLEHQFLKQHVANEMLEAFPYKSKKTTPSGVVSGAIRMLSNDWKEQLRIDLDREEI